MGDATMSIESIIARIRGRLGAVCCRAGFHGLCVDVHSPHLYWKCPRCGMRGVIENVRGSGYQPLDLEWLDGNGNLPCQQLGNLSGRYPR